MKITWYDAGTGGYYTTFKKTEPVEIGVQDNQHRPIALIGQIEQPPNSPNIFHTRVMQERGGRAFGNMGRTSNYGDASTLEAAVAQVELQMTRHASRLAKFYGANGV